MIHAGNSSLLAQQTLENLDDLVSNFYGTLQSTQVSRPVTKSTDRFVVKNDPDCLLDQESFSFPSERISEHEREGEDGSDRVCDGLSSDVRGGS